MPSAPLRRPRPARRLAALAAIAPVVSASACAGGDGGADAPSRAETQAVGVLHVAWSVDRDSVRLDAAPPPVPPVAYLSRSEQRIYVARDRRDAVRHLLGAYISVSTDLWRIRFPSDDPRVPIMPDDEAREFMETPLEVLDPRAPPGVGDVRIYAGRDATVTLPGTCLAPDGAVSSAALPPLTVRRLRASGDTLAAETFGVVGTARVHEGQDCAGPATDSVVVLTWALEPRLPPPPPILRR